MYALCEGTSSFPSTFTYLSGFLLFFSSTHRLYTGERQGQWGEWMLTQLNTFYWTMVGYRPQRLRKAYCLGPTRDTLSLTLAGGP